MNQVFWVQYQTNQPVKIKTHYVGKQKRRKPLSVVAHVIGAAKQTLTPRFDATPMEELTLHSVVDGVEGPALAPDLPLSTLSAGLTAMTALVIRSKPIRFNQSEVSIEVNGIHLDSPHLERIDLLTSIARTLETNRFVLLSSPAKSGKTSVLQLFTKRVNTPCIYARAGEGSFCADVLRQAGIDMETKSFNNPSAQLIVMIDDAQNCYHDRSGWRSLIKEIPLRLPASVKFIISATHALKGGIESPVEIGYLPKFSRQDFLLSENEATEFLDSRIGLRDGMKFGALKQNIIAQCGGLVGALRLSVNSLNRAFSKSHPSESEALIFYLSVDAVSWLPGVFGNPAYPRDDNFKDFLAKCFTSELTSAPTSLRAPDERRLFILQKTGILVEEGGFFKFSSIMSRRHVIEWLYPYRSPNMPQSLRVLIKSCIEDMSCHLLAGSVVAGFPEEATFQHLLMEGLQKFTPPTCSICPELSKMFPDGNQTGGSEIDFYVNGSLRWGVGLLVQGRGFGEHIDRFGENGKYAMLAVQDYVVVDFRSSPDGEATSVQSHPKRVSVVFKEGDFSVCKCIFGLDEEPTELRLRC
ncbi:hypothetical protein CcCBS67573_g09472 [Chytriomyces confervae]|uniref:Uncharacterized protein n=1 Tax=Chytriomyces confervae TaxID=246404 RepID=A0A507DUI4_9FUNG|nr:hypothetical protein CcCBS67573_g09472 [Chytriomyces confervae]